MKFIEHPLFLAVVCFSGSVGCAFVAWVAISSYSKNEPVSWEMLAFGLFWLWGAWSAGAKLFGFKPTAIRLAVEEYGRELAALSYQAALEDARTNCVQIPQELALRKINPVAQEWCAFEKDGISFTLEKDEVSGRAKTTFYR